MPRGRESEAVTNLPMLDPHTLGSSAEVASRAGLTCAEVKEVVQLFEALRRWHEAAAAHSESSRHTMRLGETEMKAIRFLLARQRQGSVVTPTMLAAYLGITGPSVTRMLDRLETAGHVQRQAHPRDRRALSIVVSKSTMESARESVGRDHARRFAVAAQLTSEERSLVTRFLTGLASIPVAEQHGAPRYADDEHP